VTLADDVGAVLGEGVRLLGSVGGGCINTAARGVTASGTPFFVKTNDRAPAGMFVAEAAGLAALRDAGGCRVPAVLGVREDLLVLEWIDSGSAGAGYSEALGRGLATQHRVTRALCGFDSDNYIGSTPQPNPDERDWVVFFRDHRLGFQHDLLRERGRSSRALDAALDGLRRRLDDLLRLPSERPALLHGDLWGGNAMPGPNGEPVIYDPATYFGCREADLAMTQLFGGFGQRFFAAYEEAFPLAPGYDERRDIYNVYHILNHANLFGGGYSAQATAMAQRYL